MIKIFPEIVAKFFPKSGEKINFSLSLPCPAQKFGQKKGSNPYGLDNLDRKRLPKRENTAQKQGTAQNAAQKLPKI